MAIPPYTFPQVSLYCQSTFDIPNPTPGQQAIMTSHANEIGSAGFSTVMLGRWHARVENGEFNIYYNDTPYGPDLSWTMNNATQLIQNSTDGARYITLAFELFESDFDAITQNIAQFQYLIDSFFNAYHINGLDFRIKGGYTKENLETLRVLSTWVATYNTPGYMPNIIITASPADMGESAWWKALIESPNIPSLTWYNLHCATPDDYVQWLDNTGLASTIALYGLNIASLAPQTPEEVTSLVADTCSKFPGMGGGLVRSYEDILGASSVWAQAVNTGLNCSQESSSS